MPFQAAYREHFASIWRAVQRFGVPNRDALDATQDVFLIAYRRWHEFEGRSTLRTWLFGIAFRVVAARQRRAGNRRERLGEAFAPFELAQDPSQTPERRESVQLFNTALGRLPLEQRAVFTLFELEGFSGEEIAAALDVPVGTVRSRLRLARANFSRAVHALSRAFRDTPRRIGGKP